MNKFKVGDKVKARAFVDCFGKFIPEVVGLTVESVNRHEINGYKDGTHVYYRVKAVSKNGLGYVEGAESYFEPSHS